MRAAVSRAAQMPRLRTAWALPAAPARRARTRHAPRCGITTDAAAMALALRAARLAGARGEVPVGAVVVGADGGVLAEAGNAVESSADCTAHAEMLCLRRAMRVRGAWRLAGCVLYCTLEPCAMCISAASLARVERVVYGARDLRLGGCGTWVDLVGEKHPFHAFQEVRGGVLEEECGDVMRQFFRRRRVEAADAKRARREELERIE